MISRDPSLPPCPTISTPTAPRPHSRASAARSRTGPSRCAARPRWRSATWAMSTPPRRSPGRSAPTRSRSAARPRSLSAGSRPPRPRRRSWERCGRTPRYGARRPSPSAGTRTLESSTRLTELLERRSRRTHPAGRGTRARRLAGGRAAAIGRLSQAVGDNRNSSGSRHLLQYLDLLERLLAGVPA